MDTESDKSFRFGGINTEGSLWVLIPQLVASSATAVALLLLIFWLTFNELPLFAFGFAIVFVVLQILVIIGFRFQRRPESHSQNVKSSQIDRLGGFWLLACCLGALLGWICGSLGDGADSMKDVFYAASIFFSVGLPVVTMLPNVRYIRGRAALIQIPILTFITMLPVLIGIYYLPKLFK